MARIVQLHDKNPLVLKKSDIQGETVAICRCGLSAAWPFCDGSHRAARIEEDGHLYAYTRNGAGELERSRVTAVADGELDPRRGIPRPHETKRPSPGDPSVA